MDSSATLSVLFSVGPVPAETRLTATAKAFDKLRVIAAPDALWALGNQSLAARFRRAVVAVSHASAGTGPTVGIAMP